MHSAVIIVDIAIGPLNSDGDYTGGRARMTTENRRSSARARWHHAEARDLRRHALGQPAKLHAHRVIRGGDHDRMAAVAPFPDLRHQRDARHEGNPEALGPRVGSPAT